jgi:hypothetical protein
MKTDEGVINNLGRELLRVLGNIYLETLFVAPG